MDVGFHYAGTLSSVQAEHKAIFLSEERHQLLMITLK
jgi:hypothetical protein